MSENLLPGIVEEEKIKISKDVTKAIIRAVVANNGTIIQKTMAIEEMAELTKAVTKTIRGYDAHKTVSEEMADVLVTFESLKEIFNNDKWVEYWYYVKLRRLQNRLPSLNCIQCNKYNEECVTCLNNFTATCITHSYT